MSSEEKPSGIPVSITRTIPIKLTSTPARIPEVHIKEVSQPEDLSEASEASQSVAHIIQIRRLNRPSSMYQPKVPEDSQKLEEPQLPLAKPTTPKLDMRKQEENESAAHVLKDSNLIAIKAVGIITECPGDVESTSEEVTSSGKVGVDIKKPVEKKPSLQSVESASSQFDVSEIPLDLVEVKNPDEEIEPSEVKQDVENANLDEPPADTIMVQEYEKETSNEANLPQTASAPVLSAETSREREIFEKVEHAGRSKTPSPEERQEEGGSAGPFEEKNEKEEATERNEIIENPSQEPPIEEKVKKEETASEEKIEVVKEPAVETVRESPEVIRDSDAKIGEVDEDPVLPEASEIAVEQKSEETKKEDSEAVITPQSSEITVDQKPEEIKQEDSTVAPIPEASETTVEQKSEEIVEEIKKEDSTIVATSQSSETTVEQKPEEIPEETKKEDSAVVSIPEPSEPPQESAPIMEEPCSNVEETPSIAPEQPTESETESKEKLDPIDDPDHPEYRPIIHQQSFEIPIIFDNTPNSLTQRAESLQKRLQEELEEEEHEDYPVPIPVETEGTEVEIPVHPEAENEKPSAAILESQYEPANEEGLGVLEEEKKEVVSGDEVSATEVTKKEEKVNEKEKPELEDSEAKTSKILVEEKPPEEPKTGVVITDDILKEEIKESETVPETDIVETTTVVPGFEIKEESEIPPIDETPIEVDKEEPIEVSEKIEEEDGFVFVSSDTPLDEVKVQQEKEQQQTAPVVQTVPETSKEEEKEPVQESEDKKEEKTQSPGDIQLVEMKPTEKSPPKEASEPSPEPSFVMVPAVQRLTQEEKSESVTKVQETESKTAPLAKEESLEPKEPSPVKQMIERKDSFDVSNMKKDSTEEKPKIPESSIQVKSRVIPQIVETRPELDPDDIDIVIEEAEPEDKYPVTLRKHKQEKESSGYLAAEETREGTPRPVVAVAPTSRIEEVKEKEEKPAPQEPVVRKTSVIRTDDNDDSEAPLIRVKRKELTTEFDVYKDENPQPPQDHGFIIKKEVLDESEEIAQKYRDREAKLKERLARQSTSPVQLGPKQNSAQKSVDESKFFARKVHEEQHRLSPKRIVISNQVPPTTAIHTDLREANQEFTHSPKSPSPSRTEESLSPRTLTRIHNLNVIFENGRSFDGGEVIHHHPVFVKDTSKYWYKPNISREDAINMLRDKPPGTFVVRDSNSFPGAFGLALKVSKPPEGVPAGDGTELVRHFLIEPSPKGVKLKGCNNEPVFGTLAALVYQHSITPMALPCRLILPEYDPASTPEHLNAAQALLEQGAACNVSYIYSFDTESLTGPEAVRKTVREAFEQFARGTIRAVNVHFKVSSQGITLTDNTRSLFFRRHYPVQSVIFAGIDPEDRKWDNNSVAALPPTYVRQARVFGFVARKVNSQPDNACHIFAELDPEQPASAVVNFITKVMMGQHQRMKTLPQ